MANITCAISGTKFEVSFLDSLNLPSSIGYYHPIFAAPQKALYNLYSAHCKGRLSKTDSYLLFLAFLHSSGLMIWDTHANLNPNNNSTTILVENNISQLISALERSNVITSSAFEQPYFRVTEDNASLQEIHLWIEALDDNIYEFYNYRADAREKESLRKVQADLSYLILSGEPPEVFAEVIAEWANKAAIFPEELRASYIKTISACFDAKKMFSTPLSLLKEVKAYCENNIEAGSIHFHTLMQVINEGIFKHIDYLGGSSTALGYTILHSLTDSENGTGGAKEAAILISIAATAPSAIPILQDYPDKISYLKAKLAYKVKENVQAKEAEDASTSVTIKAKPASIVTSITNIALEDL